jgi:hypothetical protein
MKINEIYNLAIKMGVDADFRGRQGVEKLLERKKSKFNNFSEKDAVLIQWAMPNRLDLILSHDKEHTNFWNHQIANDPVYNSNIVKIGNNQMWISSASSIIPVVEYHKKFISVRQHQLRSQLYVDYATLLLKHTQHGFLLTYNSEYLKDSITDTTNWYWHDKFCGMHEFRKHSKYADLDLEITQPIPLIYFDFIRKFIQPRFDLPWRDERDILAVENMLYRKYNESIKNQPQ